MKKIILSLFIASLIIIAFALNKQVLSYGGGAPTGSTNAPGEISCSAMLCHNSTPNTGTGAAMLDIMEDISNGYVPGATYSVMPFVSQDGSTKSGFQTVALLSNGQGAGTVTITYIKTKVDTAGGKEYVSHTPSGNLNVGLHDWMYDWTAPPQGSGTVTIYGAFIAANGNGSASGDSIYTDSLVIPEMSTGINRGGASEFFRFNVFPALTKEGFTVFYFSEENCLMKFSIFDISGNLILKRSYDAVPGENSFQVDFMNYPAGIYFISVDGANGMGIKKIVKLS